MTAEKATHILVYEYGIYCPTQKQILNFIMYGKY